MSQVSQIEKGGQKMGSQSCAYCNYHKKYMTVKKLRSKRCLSKLDGNNVVECRHLIKLIRHPFWIPQEVINNKQRYKTIKRRMR